MPMYEYTCDSCQHDFEFLLRGSEQATCPECSGAKLTKRISVPSAPVMRNGQLPMAKPKMGEPCGAPSCCMGRCQTP